MRGLLDSPDKWAQQALRGYEWATVNASTKKAGKKLALDLEHLFQPD